MPKKKDITVEGKAIAILTHRQDEYISLTDMAKYQDSTEPRFVISNWMSTYYTRIPGDMGRVQ